jgi:uncharacterized protein
MKSCNERKKYLLGGEIVYPCELIALRDEFGILKYLVDRQHIVGSLIITPDTISYAFYWTDRPYVLYSWFNSNGQVIGHYFNVADSISLSAHEFSWRDLIVDILILPAGQIEILDEDEIPESLDPDMRKHIESIKQLILQNHQTIIDEISEILNSKK